MVRFIWDPRVEGVEPMEFKLQDNVLTSEKAPQKWAELLWFFMREGRGQGGCMGVDGDLRRVLYLQEMREKIEILEVVEAQPEEGVIW